MPDARVALADPNVKIGYCQKNISAGASEVLD